MIHVSIKDEFVSLVSEQNLIQVATNVLNNQKIALSDVELTIVISDDLELQNLNRQYLQVDAPTDVLSFPINETNPETGRKYLGDVIISYQTSLQQSLNAGHPVTDEIQLLVVHGVLHLLGYDHIDQEDKHKMWVTQKEILEQLGCHIAIIADE